MRVRVGIVDSGINPDHPHVGQVMGGVLSRVRSPRRKFGARRVNSLFSNPPNREFTRLAPNFFQFQPT